MNAPPKIDPTFVVATLVDEAGGLRVWRHPVEPGQPSGDIIDTLSGYSQTREVTVAVRSAQRAGALLFARLDVDEWAGVEAAGFEEFALRMQVMGNAVHQHKPVDVIVEENRAKRQVLSVRLVTTATEASQYLSDAVSPGRIRRLDSMSLPRRIGEENAVLGEHCVIAGNLADGFTFHGPFGSVEEAAAEFGRCGDEWIVVDLHNPLAEACREEARPALRTRESDAG